MHYEISAFPVFDNEGKVAHVIEFKKDISDEKRMIEQLIRSEKLASIGNMTAGVAHEMNNPLSGISGNAANLMQMPEKYGLNEKGLNRVTIIMNSAIRATTIMNDLLHLSDKVEQKSILVNINGLIMKTVNALHVTGAQQIERSFSLDDSIELFQCDPSKIQQVIVHIVTNAMQAIMDKKNSPVTEESFRGQLSISTLKTDKEIIITITDNGIGITPSNQTKIFNPFFSTRPTGQGTGLGLSVSHKIIEEHGGKIFFECMTDLTVFTIHLPLVRSGQLLSQNI
jgi:signal transduction histidine kinase